MDSSTHETLQACGNIPSTLVDRPFGSSPFLFIGDHAGNAIPAQLQKLGLSDAELSRHIGWDIGIRALGARLSERLDATFIHQAVSRLVVDCNRDPARADAMPEVSDGTAIPGNRALTEADRAWRVGAVHTPYHATIAAELRRRAGRPVILVALHSFTPAMNGHARPWHCGILHDGGDTRFSLQLLDRLRRIEGLCVGDNEPYAMNAIDYTIPHHAYAAGLPYAEIEVRQDLLSDDEGLDRWRDILAEVLEDAATTISSPTVGGD